MDETAAEPNPSPAAPLEAAARVSPSSQLPSEPVKSSASQSIPAKVASASPAAPGPSTEARTSLPTRRTALPGSATPSDRAAQKPRTILPTSSADDRPTPPPSLPAESSPAAIPAATSEELLKAPAEPAKHAQPEVRTPPKSADDNLNDSQDKNGESPLSEPGSRNRSPRVGTRGLEDEIVVGAHANGSQSPPAPVPGQKDYPMADAQEEPIVSHYPKRKRTSIFNDLSESKIEIPTSIVDQRSPLGNSKGKGNPTKVIAGGIKGVLVGYWRDSPVPDEKGKHSVIGFIDVRDRLRTRIQPITVHGEPVSPDHPLPPGPGGSWVTFERIIFSKHLVGLDQQQVKEYVRMRYLAFEETEEGTKAAEAEAVKDAVRRVKESPGVENSAVQPLIAYGPEIPSHQLLRHPEPKRRRVSGVFSSSNASPTLTTNGTAQESPRMSQAIPHIYTFDPLKGTRPTRILLGHWKGSNELKEEDRHAVYGILGQNDMFRVKVVRETRNGRFVDGNFPSGAGALWIPYEEVAFEPHLRQLNRMEMKEYCRVRQWLLDHGEEPKQRAENDVQAVIEARGRCNGFKHGSHTLVPPVANSSPGASNGLGQPNGRPNIGGEELRQSRRLDSRSDGRVPRQPVVEYESGASRNSSADAQERTNVLARREIARVEAAQTRADRHATNRERAAVAAAEAASAAAAAAAAANSTPPAAINGRARFHESEDMQRLNEVWARQESLRLKPGFADAKIYDGLKYERKPNGPFMGKLVSQGAIITIDGEDFVEYRVLTKPSFF